MITNPYHGALTTQPPRLAQDVHLRCSRNAAHVVLVGIVVVVVVVVVDVGDGVADSVEGQHHERQEVVGVEAVAAVTIY